MQMLYRLSYVGGGAARGTSRHAREPPSFPMHQRARAPSPKMRRQIFRTRQKIPLGLSTDSRKVVGDYESSTLADGEVAVNRKFATDAGTRLGLSDLDEKAGPAIRRGGPLLRNTPDSRSRVDKPGNYLKRVGWVLWTGVDYCERRRGMNWSGKRDSNPRPSAWKADALATELFPLHKTI